MSRKLNITKKEMIAHLKSYKPTSRVGETVNSHDCVVARMVKKVYKVDQVQVDSHEVTYLPVGDKTRKVRSYLCPMWLGNFIVAMDALTTKYTTAEQALTFFKK